MKSPYVSELQPNSLVSATLLVLNKDVRQKKTGEPYLILMLGDRSGDIEGRMWDNAADVVETFDRDDFVRVRGLLQVHHNRMQLVIHKLQRQGEETVDFTDFFPASERSGDEMMAELRELIAGFSCQPLKALCSAVIEDPAITPRLRIAPAAKNVHHAYLGGLLEHVLSMARVAKLLAGHYRDIDLDLLLTGVILHDIGKVHELTYDRSFGYSTQGQLLGHIYIGLRIVDDKIRAIPEFPDRLRSLVEHLILSHHGELEYGSPKVPVCLEALLLHHIDNLDARMECMRSTLEKDRHVDGCWTGYNSVLDRSVLKKHKFLSAAEEIGPAVPGVSTTPQAREVVAASAPVRRPSTSPFAEKLMGALGKE